jgi:hypothetical protein
MKINYSFLLLTILAFQSIVFAEETWIKEFPYAALSSSYGVLNKNDLIIDSWYGNPGLTDGDGGRWGYPRWICIDKKYVKFKYTTWFATDEPVGPGVACDYYFEIKDKNQIHQFGGRRAHPVETCRRIWQRWKIYTSLEKYVCINGDGGYPDEVESKKIGITVRNWNWEKFKTKRGCYSNFQGYCYITYWKTHGYPLPLMK